MTQEQIEKKAEELYPLRNFDMKVHYANQHRREGVVKGATWMQEQMQKEHEEFVAKVNEQDDITSGISSELHSEKDKEIERLKGIIHDVYIDLCLLDGMTEGEAERNYDIFATEHIL